MVVREPFEFFFGREITATISHMAHIQMFLKRVRDRQGDCRSIALLLHLPLRPFHDPAEALIELVAWGRRVGMAGRPHQVRELGQEMHGRLLAIVLCLRPIPPNFAAYDGESLALTSQEEEIVAPRRSFAFDRRPMEPRLRSGISSFAAIHHLWCNVASSSTMLSSSAFVHRCFRAVARYVAHFVIRD